MSELDAFTLPEIPDYSKDTWKPAVVLRPSTPNVKLARPTLRPGTANVKSDGLIRASQDDWDQADNGFDKGMLDNADEDLSRKLQKDVKKEMSYIDPEIYEHGHSKKAKEVSRKLSKYLQGVKVREERKMFEDTDNPWAVGLAGKPHHVDKYGVPLGEERAGIYLNPIRTKPVKDTYLVHEFAHELHSYLDPVKIREIRDRYEDNLDQLKNDGSFGARTSYEYFAERMNGAIARAMNGTQGKEYQPKYWKEKQENEYWDALANDFLQGKVQNRVESNYNANGEKDENTMRKNAKGEMEPIPYAQQKYRKETKAYYN